MGRVCAFAIRGTVRRSSSSMVGRLICRCGSRRCARYVMLFASCALIAEALACPLAVRRCAATLRISARCAHTLISGRVAIVGMSQGVRAALGFALQAPQMVSCLVLDGPPEHRSAELAADDDVPLDHYRSLIRTHGMAAFRREWRRHPLVCLRTGDPHMREILSAMLQRYPGNDLWSPRRMLALLPVHRRSTHWTGRRS